MILTIFFFSISLSKDVIMASDVATLNSQISINDLREHFECPVCYNVPTKAPIYHCGDGHFICSDCKPRLTTCPICRIRIRPNRFVHYFYLSYVL